ncbi:MAG: hypothetical protein M1824_003430 [Vezdaea acicularis]|nr:MAG: hypothetical protein M1824_003430 [Vezdaea acicularis]
MPLPTPLHIAILECDTPLPQTAAKYGGYGGVFISLLRKSVDYLNAEHDGVNSGAKEGETVAEKDGAKEGKKVGFLDKDKDLDFTTWDVEHLEQYPKLEDVDAILLTGSRHNAFDNPPWITRLISYTRAALDTGRVRVIGVCFGHQIAARALGAEVGRNEKGWEVSVCSVDVNGAGKGVWGREKLDIFQMHRDIVLTLPPTPIPPLSTLSTTTTTSSTTHPPTPPPSSPSSPSPASPIPTPSILASSPPCPIQSLYIPSRLLTVQGHPEFTEEIVTEILAARKEAGVFDQRLFEDGMGRVRDRHDGVVVAAGFVRFLLE